jgi:uncharacterized membrane protein
MIEGYYHVSLLVGLVSLATILGILALYSHTIMPGLRKVDNATFVKSFQAIDRKIINPVFMLQFFAPLIVLGFAAFYAYQHQLTEAKYTLAALACYLVAVVITMAVNVPLNDGIKKAADTADLESLKKARTQFNESKWLIFNHIRTAFTLIATCFAAAAIWASKLI